MKYLIRTIEKLVIIFIAAFFLNSCIIDEFRFGRMHLKDDWNMELVMPLFYGNLDFKDLIYLNGIAGSTEGEINYLKVNDDSVLAIPTLLIYEPHAFIDSFNFLIEGDDYLTYVRFDFEVTNGSPLPLRLGLRFFEKHYPDLKGPLILPPAFDAGKFVDGKVIPVSDSHEWIFQEEELTSFKRANRIEFIAWFEPSANIQPGDTLLADYPLEISIRFTGVVEDQYE